MRRLSYGALFALLMIVQWVIVEPTLGESNIKKRAYGDKEVQSERDEQVALYNYYFRKRNLKYETKLANLKKEAIVPKWRIPYSAAIHPETSGGLSNIRGGGRGGMNVAGGGGRLSFGRRSRGSGSSGGSGVLSKYDRAFNGGQNLANSYEVRRLLGTERAFFVRSRLRRNNESWEGYCSGFAASSIRHPEPFRAVDAGTVGGTPGLLFQPSDIKALLTCIYNRTTDESYLFLAPPSARDGGPNMGTFHLTLANYVGQAGFPVGYDTTKGEVAWNYPIYTYKVHSITDAGKRGEIQYKNVVTTITYTYYDSDHSRQTDRETGARVGNNKQSLTLRYYLELDQDGSIVGGSTRTGSGHFLWIPLYAVQANKAGTTPGNPHVDVKKVLALARASALPEIQKKYDEATIGPAIDPAVTAKKKKGEKKTEKKTEEKSPEKKNDEKKNQTDNTTAKSEQ